MVAGEIGQTGDHVPEHVVQAFQCKQENVIIQHQFTVDLFALVRELDTKPATLIHALHLNRVFEPNSVRDETTELSRGNNTRGSRS